MLRLLPIVPPMADIRQYSDPMRIAEAVPYLEQNIATFKKVKGADVKDVTPMLYLAVALHKQPGEEQKALQIFEEAAEGNPMSQYHQTLLWARSNIARLLRRLNRAKEAKTHEDMIA